MHPRCSPWILANQRLTTVESISVGQMWLQRLNVIRDAADPRRRSRCFIVLDRNAACGNAEQRGGIDIGPTDTSQNGDIVSASYASASRISARIAAALLLRRWGVRGALIERRRDAADLMRATPIFEFYGKTDVHFFRRLLCRVRLRRPVMPAC